MKDKMLLLNWQSLFNYINKCKMFSIRANSIYECKSIVGCIVFLSTKPVNISQDIFILASIEECLIEKLSLGRLRYPLDPVKLTSLPDVEILGDLRDIRVNEFLLLELTFPERKNSFRRKVRSRDVSRSIIGGHPCFSHCGLEPSEFVSPEMYKKEFLIPDTMEFP